MKIALAGVGEVAVQQHLPAITASDDWELAATCSRSGTIAGIPAYTDFEQMLIEHPDINTVSLCHPPKPRLQYAQLALRHQCHVMLEKPPGATVAECVGLQHLAEKTGCSLFTTWHSQQADMVETAEQWLADKQLEKINIVWREDVGRWHAGQEWIWQGGGFGVLDPGINALSIVTKILPGHLYPTSARLQVPRNKQSPIAAEIEFGYDESGVIHAEFDWRERGDQRWDITAVTDRGTLKLSNGGATLHINDQLVENTGRFEEIKSDSAANTLGNEYKQLYARMSQLVKEGCCDVDLRPLQLVADSFLIASVTYTEPFIE